MRYPLRRKKMLTPNPPFPAKTPRGERNPGNVCQRCWKRTNTMATPRKPSRLGIRPVSIGREASLDGRILREEEFPRIALKTTCFATSGFFPSSGDDSLGGQGRARPRLRRSHFACPPPRAQIGASQGRSGSERPFEYHFRTQRPGSLVSQDIFHKQPMKALRESLVRRAPKILL